MTDHVRHFVDIGSRVSRRNFLTASATIAAGLVAGTVLRAPGPAAAAGLKVVRFSEAVHNLGYINLYVGMHAGIFEKHGLKMNVTAAGGDTQTFAAVLGGSADFAIGDATMVQMSREAGGPGVVVGTVVQRAHYFGVSKNLEPITDPKQFKGLTIVTSPEPNTNYSVAKRMLENAGLKIGEDTKILQVNPGTEIGAMLAGQADMAIAYQPSVASAVAQGAKVVFDFSNYVGPFCNTGIMVLPSFIEENPRSCRRSSPPSRNRRARPMPTRPSPRKWRARSSPICRRKSWTLPSTPNWNTRFRPRRWSCRRTSGTT